MNCQADANPEALRISIDTKAKVKIGEFSRNGKSRDLETPKAVDHDFRAQTQLVPFGILAVASGLFTIIFGVTSETSDFIVDALLRWWRKNQPIYRHIKELVINLDNGPQVASRRTQFIKRMIEFADVTGLRIHLVYYPPYHSKYNAVERCWGILENHWNGTLLDSIRKTLFWAATMTWKGLSPAIGFMDRVYPKRVSVSKQEMRPLESRLIRSKTLPKWDIIIEPKNW